MTWRNFASPNILFTRRRQQYLHSVYLIYKSIVNQIIMLNEINKFQDL